VPVFLHPGANFNRESAEGEWNFSAQKLLPVNKANGGEYRSMAIMIAVFCSPAQLRRKSKKEKLTTCSALFGCQRKPDRRWC
jgi:hypothetical protein